MTASVNKAMGYQSTQNLNVIVERHASFDRSFTRECATR
jgi:hypothetical protein